MFARKVHDLRDLGFRDLVRIDAAFADPVMMHMQHYSCGGFVVLAKEAFQNMHDEFHGGVVVVENEDPVHVRPLGLRLGLGDDRSARSALLVPALAIIVGHPGRGAARQYRAHWSLLAIWGRHSGAVAVIFLELHHGRAGTRPVAIIEIRTHLFQVGNSLKAAPFRDKRQDSAILLTQMQITIA